LDVAIPNRSDANLLIATWNIRDFGGLTREWLPSGSYSPKRDLRALRDTLKYLGPDWAFLMTDVSRGSARGRRTVGLGDLVQKRRLGMAIRFMAFLYSELGKIEQLR